jgi:hypothetical protein
MANLWELATEIAGDGRNTIETLRLMKRKALDGTFPPKGYVVENIGVFKKIDRAALKNGWQNKLLETPSDTQITLRRPSRKAEVKYELRDDASGPRFVLEFLDLPFFQTGFLSWNRTTSEALVRNAGGVIPWQSAPNITQTYYTRGSTKIWGFSVEGLLVPNGFDPNPQAVQMSIAPHFHRDGTIFLTGGTPAQTPTYEGRIRWPILNFHGWVDIRQDPTWPGDEWTPYAIAWFLQHRSTGFQQ